MNRALVSVAVAGLSVVGLSVVSCRATKSEPKATLSMPRPQRQPAVDASMPKAVIYKTDGDYIDNVPVTLNALRNRLLSYPAPTDITPASCPLQLTGGYLLDRRGIMSTTAFLHYTYREYAALSAAPSPDSVMQAVIPGSRITEMVRLPITLDEAQADTARCNDIIRNGLKQCTLIMYTPTLDMEEDY